MGIWYATREDVKQALDAKETARNNAQVDRAISAASRSVDGLCHRTFYPQQATRSWDWPAAPGPRPWRLWLDANELISLDSLTSGGRAIDTADVLLEPNQYGPPYNRIELNISSNSTFGGGPTPQRDIVGFGLFGYRDDSTAVGTRTGLGASETTLTVDAAASAALGVGSLLRLDDERLTVTGRSMADTGQTITADLDQQMKTVMVPVADGSEFAQTETILIDAERMRVEEIAGNNLIVRRAWDGSPNAPHSSGAVIYAPRALRVERGVVGTTAAAHTAGGSVLRWDPPPLVRQLTIAEAVWIIAFESAGGARVLRSGESGKEGKPDLGALQALRDATYDEHGRKARTRGV
ncbi:hypothetical protein [Streptomyces sp. NRRL S-337]|uniref:hypothetical protein n=1 Tax=Streptomyces sp. NRRL S-337 TaxID=1463900 RepID=UPI0004C64920|nr:hypothetical protein [Streptomyces sp. NRRL S-337]